MKIGIISDTHGILREGIKEILKGCHIIFHGGDIGTSNIIDELEEIAPVIAVKGNNDKEQWAQSLPYEIYMEVENKKIYMIHDLKCSQADFNEGEIDIVISGHTHIYKEEQKGNILYLNPGGAGPRRFGKEVTAVILWIEKKTIKTEKALLDKR